MPAAMVIHIGPVHQVGQLAVTEPSKVREM
jgi:hypothetical protein